jgi:hypothetical protein
MDKIKECDVFNGLCGAYNNKSPGKCMMYSCTGHVWLRNKLEDRIMNCLHRQEMNSDAGKTAVETAILNYFRSKK